jgi:CRISPR-associated protein (TIGR03986 family)
MFRSVFEILTLSGMEFVSHRRLFYRSFAEARHGEADVKSLYDERFTRPLKEGRVVGGMLIQDGEDLILRVSRRSDVGFALVRADDFRDKFTERTYNTTQACSVQLTGDRHDILHIPKANRIPGSLGLDHLVCPGRIVGKTGRTLGQVILSATGSGYDDYPVPESVYADYKAWGQAAHGNRFGTKDAPRELKGGQPAFALLDNTRETIEVIGANMMMPMRYERSIDQAAIVGTLVGLEGTGGVLDMAQAVFGRVVAGKEDKAASVRGRVFFEDAVCATASPWLEDGPPVRTPNIMSGPKPTAFQNYVEQNSGVATRHWDAPDAQIRGHKRYWHRSPVAALASLSQTPSAAGDKQSTRIQPVRKGTEFRGRLRFENLTDIELGALMASVRLPKEMAHKFGMGKNLGLGSIRVNIDRTVLIDPVKRYSNLASGAGVITDPEPTLKAAYRAFVGKVSPKERKSLWARDRFRDFAAMAVWNQEIRPSDNRTRQISIGSRLEIEAEPQKRQWKDRWVLPPPQLVLSGDLPSFVDIYTISDDEAIEPDNRRATANDHAVAKPPSPTVYKQGQEIRLIVVERDGFNGTVRLPDGRTLPVPMIGMCEAGQESKFKVLSVDGKAQIKSLKRS